METLPNLLVLANKRHATDFRKYLMRAVERVGSDALHVYCWDEIVLSNNSGEIFSVKQEGASDLVLRELGTFLDKPLIVLTGLGGNESATATRIQHALPHAAVVYDVYDDLMFGATGRLLTERMLQDAIWRCRCSHTIVLDEALQGRYPGSYHLDNASHLQPIAQVAQADQSAIVYIGSIDSRVDFEWLDSLGEQNVTIDIHGSVHMDSPVVTAALQELLRRRSNIVYRGPYDNDDLWGILGNYRIGIVPYHVDHLMTRHVNPDKIFHYLNAGLEVVAAPFPQARRHAGHIHLAERHADWEHVLAAVGEAPRRGDWSAEANSWERRWNELANAILD